jgi:hypothetical protein
MSRDPSNAGAVAFKRAGDPNVGEFSDAIYGTRTVLAQHIFAMAKQGERDPHRLIDGALMRLTL